MLTRWDELKLIAQCVTGDNRRAFERLVVEYSDDLRRFLLNLTLGNAPLTDDLAQDTFIKAYMSLGSFRGMSRFRTWLFRIAYNEYQTYLRKHHEVRLEDSKDPPDDPGDWTMSHHSDDMRMDVERCMAVLNDTERTAVLLYYINDFTVSKICDIMDKPAGTVKSCLSRARTKMLKLLNEDNYEV